MINCTEINTVVIGNKQKHKLAVDTKVESLRERPVSPDHL